MQKKLEHKVFILFGFFCPTDRPTITRNRAMGNETFYWDGLMKKQGTVNSLKEEKNISFTPMKHLLHSLYYASSLSSILLRNVPPQSICPSGVRKRRGIPRYIRQGLQTWFREHGPYPNHAEKEMLAKKYDITLGQVTMLYRGSIENSNLECFDSRSKLVQSTLVNSAKDTL